MFLNQAVSGTPSLPYTVGRTVNGIPNRTVVDRMTATGGFVCSMLFFERQDSPRRQSLGERW